MNCVLPAHTKTHLYCVCLDRNGNCRPDDCEDADPGDNTDICYVEMDKNPDSPRVLNGFAVYDGDNGNGEG